METRNEEMDLPERVEERLFLVEEQINPLIEELGDVVTPLRFGNGGFVQTLYLNTPDHVVSFGTALRARRYPTEFPQGYVDPNDEFFLEIKRGNLREGRQTKEKKRARLPLIQLVGFLEDQQARWETRDEKADQTPFLELPEKREEVRPLVGVEYHRRHFVPKKEKMGFRLTIDDTITYYACPEDASNSRTFQMTKLGSESHQRLELKIDRRRLSDPNIAPLYTHARAVVEGLGGFRAVSKRYKAYERLHREQTKTLPEIVNELKGFEIEAKLSLDEPELFSHLKVHIANGGFQGFILSPDFPHASEVQARHGYVVDKDGNELGKLLFSGSKVKFNRKEPGSIVEDPYHLGCILKRAEEKGKYVTFTREQHQAFLASLPDSALVLGYLNRTKKKFYVLSTVSERKYGISVDRCITDDCVLVQLEIEYLGASKQPAQPELVEPEIVRDIADITRQCLRQYPGRLIPTAQTKFAWMNDVKAGRETPKDSQNLVGLSKGAYA